MEEALRNQNKSNKRGTQMPVFTRELLIHNTVLIKHKTNFTTYNLKIIKFRGLRFKTP